jgi:hypothetical protein
VVSYELLIVGNRSEHQPTSYTTAVYTLGRLGLLLSVPFTACPAIQRGVVSRNVR